MRVRLDESRITGADAGPRGRCWGDNRFGDNLPGQGSIIWGSISGGRFAQGDPRDPRRSLRPIIGGGEIGSSSTVATTTSGLDKVLLSGASEARDRLKKANPVSISAKARRTKGKFSDTSEVVFRTGNSVSLSCFFGRQRANDGSSAELTVSEICRVRAACLAESDFDLGSLAFGVGERRSANFLLAARFIDENSPSLLVLLAGVFSVGSGIGAREIGALDGPGVGSWVGWGVGWGGLASC